MAGIPRKVYRVAYRPDGTAYIAERLLIKQSRSWFTFQLSDGTTVKENGNRWSDTVLAALQQEANGLMHRFACPSVFARIDQEEAMDSLIVEAMNWGVLVGEVNEMARAAKKASVANE